MTERRPLETTDLADFLRQLRARRSLIIGITLAVTALTYLYFASRPNEYTATARVFIKTSDLDQALFGSGVFASDDRNTTNQAALIASQPIATAVARRLHYRGSPADLLESVTATPTPGSDFVTVTATQGSPTAAATLANTFVNTFITVRANNTRRKIQQAEQSLLRRMAGLPPGPASSDERGALQTQLERLRGLETLPAVNAEKIDSAEPPTSPSAPKPLRNALFAFVLALLAGSGVALVLERLDRRLKGVDDLEATFKTPLLALLPHTRDPSPTDNGSVVLPRDMDFTESVRGLRANLKLASLDRTVRTVLVTSATPGEGKTTVVRNLALVYCELGARVAVVDTDLRRSSVADTFRLDREPGLTDVIAGEVDLRRAVQHANVQLPGLSTLVAGADSGRESSDGFGILTGGVRTPNPPAVLGAEQMRVLVAELAQSYDIVLIDSPPLLTVSDALPLLPLVDAVLFVCRVTRTTRDTVRRLLRVVDRSQAANVIGVVANDMPKDEIRAGAYGYYGGYGKSIDDSPVGARR
jgi:capsular exopolysaccharide synthesis family protein